MKREKKTFTSLEECLLYRSLDTGASFVEAIMLFGMGIELTEVDDRHLKQVVESAYAALGLANDFFLFDKDFAEYLEQTNMNEPQQTSMTNSVWSCMGWHNLTAEEAKIFVRDKIIRQEQDFACLDGLSQIIIGNIVWSLRCPRYHPLFEYDANAAIDNHMLALSQPSLDDVQAACMKVSCMTPPSPGCTAIVDGLVRAPYDWCTNAPSKQFRSSMIDALNIWTCARLRPLETIKDIDSKLQNASLLLDDIGDRSPLRRGRPAAHTVYGVAETINSANLAILEATSQIQSLHSQSSVVFYERMRQIYIGQSDDLRWTRHRSCPLLDEYVQMIDGKTGGLLQLHILTPDFEPRRSHHTHRPSITDPR